MPDQVYRPYWEWEDHRAGMYRIPANRHAEILAARKLLSSPPRLENAMRAVVDAWPAAAAHQLTNMQQNRRSWLGQAACTFTVKATSTATRAAWAQLTDDERTAANRCASRVIRDWEEDHAGPIVYQPGLFNPEAE
jgi:hypothetical protein